jgi:hypothetical protein
MTNVRLRLSDPRAGRPNDAQLLNAVSTEIRTIKRHESNTSNVWNFNDTIIDVSPNTSTYLINQVDFGVPLAVLTWAPQLLTWIPRLIPIYQPQNMAFGYGLPVNLAGFWQAVSFDGSLCSADRCTFYWKDGQPYIEFSPVPQYGCSYKIRFLESGASVGTDSLTSAPINSMDADIVEVRAALSLLSTSEWMAPDTKDNRAYNAERRKDLFTTLSVTERELRRQFEAAKLQVEGDRLSMRFNPTVG